MKVHPQTALLLGLLFWMAVSYCTFAPPRTFTAASGSIEIHPTVQIGHTISVADVAFSPDTHLVATSGHTGTGLMVTILWETSSGRRLRNFPGGEKITFSPDGRQLLIADGSTTARLWDVASGKEVGNFNTKAGQIWCVAFAPDGRTILTGSGNSNDKDYTARLWDVATGREVRRFIGHTEYVQSVAFSPDGKRVLTGGFDGTARVWDRDTGRELRRINVYSGPESIPSVCALFSPDGEFVLTGSRDGITRLWSVVSGTEVRRFGGSTEETLLTNQRAISISPDGRYVLTGVMRGSLLWDFNTGQLIRRFEGHAGTVDTVAFSRDGSYALTGGFDRAPLMWDVSSGQNVQAFRSYANVVNTARFSPGGRFVLTDSELGEFGVGREHRTHVWSMETGKIERLFEDRKLLSVSADDRYLLTTRADYVVHLEETLTGQVVQHFIGHTSEVRSGALSPDGQYILTTSGDWSAETDHSTRLWDAHTGRELWHVIDQNNYVSSVKFSPGGRFFLIDRGTPRVYETATRTVVWQPKGYSFTFSPDDRFILTINESDARLYETTNWTPVWEFKDAMFPVSFSPNGRYIAIGKITDTLNVYLLDAATGQPIRSFRGHEQVVRTADFSSNSQFLLTSSPDCTSRLWRVSDGTEVVQLISFNDGGWVVVDSVSGRFDTNNLEEIKGLHWVALDDPLHVMPLEIFMRDYYEPKLLPRLLKCTQAGACEHEFKAVRNLSSINRTQPLVKITEIAQGMESDTVNVTIGVANVISEHQRDQQGNPLQSGVYDVRLFRDGQLVGYAPETDGPVKLNAQGEATITKIVRLPHSAEHSPVEFSTYAFNSDRVKSNTDHKVYELPAQMPQARGRAYIISVGVNANENPAWDLRFAANDAREFARIVPDRLRATKEYEEVIPVSLIADYTENGGVRSVTESGATKANFRAIIDLLASRAVDPMRLQGIPNADKLRAAHPEDLVLIAFSSHGYADRDGVFYLVPYDTGGNTKVADILPNCISSDELSLWLRDVDAGRMVMIVDACYSATAIEGQDFKPGPMGSRGLGQLAYDKGMMILASTQANNVALENKNLRQGLLSYALTHEGIEELLADYKPKDGTIMLGEWLGYGVERVPQLYQEVKAGKMRLLVQQGSGSASDAASSQLQQPALFDFRRRRADATLYRSTQ